MSGSGIAPSGSDSGAEHFSFLDYAKGVARRDFNALAVPNAMLGQLLMAYGDDGVGFVDFGIPEDDAATGQMANLIVQALVDARARECAFIGTTWSVPAGSEISGAGDNPERRETMMLIHKSADQPATLHVASALRYPKAPPHLCEWKPLKTASMHGGVALAINLGMKLAAQAQSLEVVRPIALWPSAPNVVPGCRCPRGLHER